MSGDKAILKKSFAFAVNVVKLYKDLTNKKEYVLSKQLLRSGTAVGALVREAQNAESKGDFVHKLGMAQKECDETIYWLELLLETAFIQQEAFNRMEADGNEILKMLKSAIKTTKSNS